MVNTFVQTRDAIGYAPVERPKMEAEMVEAARRVILAALDPTMLIDDPNRVELAKWVVLNFWTPD